jgi:hypothetical protein
MRKLTVLLVFGLLSALPMMAEEPAVPVAGPAEQVVAAAAQTENGACAVENQDSASLAIFAPDLVYKTCGIIYAPCGSPPGAGPCKWSCPCPTYTQCTLLARNGCSVCVEP